MEPTVSGLLSDKGQIILDVFKDNDSYKAQKPFKQIMFDKTAVKDGCLTVSIQLEAGVYGITLVDDVDKNDELDKNRQGAPTEGFGFSNLYLKKMKWPVFGDFKIVIRSANDIFDGKNPIDIKVKYI